MFQKPVGFSKVKLLEQSKNLTDLSVDLPEIEILISPNTTSSSSFQPDKNYL
jgi:hypothetical protein